MGITGLEFVVVVVCVRVCVWRPRLYACVRVRVCVCVCVLCEEEENNCEYLRMC